MNDKYYTPDQIQELMDAITPAELSYEDWFRAIAGFKSMGADEFQIERWCSSDPRFKSNDIRVRWNGIKDSGGVTAGTIIYLAREQGYEGRLNNYAPPSRGSRRRSEEPEEEPRRTVEFLPSVPESFADFQMEILGGMSQEEQRRAFLETMFSPNDYINFTFEAAYDEKRNKWRPSPNKEAYTREEWIQALHVLTLNSYNHDAGVWVRINPTVPDPLGALKEDGTRGAGVCDEDVADFRYALIECDNLPEEDQIKAFRRLNLPIQTLVISGGKSVHAAVRIDAKDRAEYDQRVSVLHDWCRRYGVPIDGANKNPSRMMRLPGVDRGERQQILVGLNQGCQSWEDFQFYIDGIRLGLPDLDAIEDVNGENLLPRMPEIVHETLREKEIMMISAGSKTGKTMLGIELSLAVSSGGLWLGRACKPGAVLYVNMEVNRPDFANRVENVREAMGVSLADVKGRYFIWNLRGHNVSMEDLINGIQHLLTKYHFSVIVLDPIYKLLGDLDENSAGDIGQLFSYFDRIAEMSGAAVVFVHHHSKGLQAAKVAMDRASGSGTFARAPDVMLDIIELEIPPEMEDILEFEGNPVGLRYEWTFRGYPPKKPETGFYTYPLHVPDEEGILSTARTAKEAHAADAKKMNANRSINWAEVVVTTFMELMDESYEDGKPYPGQVITDEMIARVQSKTHTSDETTKRKVRDRCTVQRAKQGKPSFILLKDTIATAAGVPLPDPPYETPEETEKTAVEEVEDYDQIRL